MRFRGPQALRDTYEKTGGGGSVGRLLLTGSSSSKVCHQYAMGPTSFSTSVVSTMAMASHGQPSRKAPSGPLLVHFLQPIQSSGSSWMRPNGGLSSSGTQNMQSSTGQYSTQAGEPAQPVQHSVMTASSLGFFLRAVAIPLERGSCFSSSGTIPGAFATSGALAICRDFTLSVKPLPARFCGQSASRPVFTRRCGSADHMRSLAPLRMTAAPCAMHYNAGASESSSPAHHVPQTVLQTPLARAARRTCVAPLFHLALPFLFRRYRLLRRAGSQLAVSRCF